MNRREFIKSLLMLGAGCAGLTTSGMVSARKDDWLRPGNLHIDFIPNSTRFGERLNDLYVGDGRADVFKIGAGSGG